MEDTEYDQYYYPDPEDFEPEPPRERGPLSRLPSRRHFRPAIFCFIIFYIASTLYARYSVGESLWVSGKMIFAYYEYWRLITALFTHADILHLLSNSLMFLIFGWLLKAYYGMLVFPVTSLFIGIITNLITVTVYEPHIRLVGASGMVYGMAALWLIFYIRYDVDRYLPVRIVRAVGFVMVMLLPSTYEPGTSYLAHAVGFLTGSFAGLLLLPFIDAHDPE